MSDFCLRTLTGDDVPAANDLRRLIGWNQTEQDWHRLLSLEPNGCFVARRGKELVGTVTTTTYRDAIAWIGMMLVHPEHRRQGIARCLMLRAIEYLDSLKIRSIRLDATPAGLPLYLQLGFISEWTLTRWRRPVNGEASVSTVLQGRGRLVPGQYPRLVKGDGDEPSPPLTLDGEGNYDVLYRHKMTSSSTTRALSHADWPAVDKLDESAFGLSRGHLLRALAQNCRDLLVWPATGRIEGWGMLRPGSIAEYLGPVACASIEGARALVQDLTVGVSATPIVWDFPDQNEAAKQIARSLGFEAVRPLTRMCLRYRLEETPQRSLFAIADPAVG